MKGATRLESTVRHMDEARKVIPRGLTSSKRDREPSPLVFRSAEGSRLTDIDGNEYIDYVAGFGPMLLGHHPEPVISAVTRSIQAGVLFGGQHAGEYELAARLVEMVPCADMALLCSSGSEATSLAVRIARAATGRKLVVKFEGHYHGWLEPLAMNLPGSPPGEDRDPPPVCGPPGLAAPDYLRICPWNDATAISGLFDRLGEDIACVIMEPIPVNAGVLHRAAAYLSFVRELCDRHGVALIFDEVITGFRLDPGGAQAVLGVTPDLTTLGKALGSGFPIAAVVGREHLMQVACQELHHLGTFNGGVPAVAAANATLEFLSGEDGEAAYASLDELADNFAMRLAALVADSRTPLVVDRIGSLVRFSWGLSSSPHRYEEAHRSDSAAIARLAQAVLCRGVHILPRGTLFLSMAHTADDVDETLAAFESVLAGGDDDGRRTPA